MRPISKKTLLSHSSHFPMTGISKLTIALFLAGFVIGSLALHILEATLYASVSSLFRDTLNAVSSLEIHGNDLFLFSFRENLKCYVLLVFFSITNVWNLYYWGFCLTNGFCHGILLTFCIGIHGMGGLLLYLSFLFPQVIILLPAFLLFMNHLSRFHANWFSFGNSSTKSHSFFPDTQKRQLLFSQLPVLALSVLLLLLASLLEGYANLPLIQHFNHIL